MKQPIKKTSSRLAKHISPAGTIKVIGGQHWLVFTPAAIRALGLKKGQRFNVAAVAPGELKLTPISRAARGKRMQAIRGRST